MGGALSFLDLAEAAGKKVNGAPTADAIHAQNALTTLKPTKCASWADFKEMIDEGKALIEKDQRYPEQKAYIEETLRKQKEGQNLKTPTQFDRGAIELPELKGFGLVMPARIEALDPQKALAMLDVKYTGTELTRPLKTQITDAVKPMKSSARAA